MILMVMIHPSYTSKCGGGIHAMDKMNRIYKRRFGFIPKESDVVLAINSFFKNDGTRLNHINTKFKNIFIYAKVNDNGDVGKCYLTWE